MFNILFSVLLSKDNWSTPINALLIIVIHEAKSLAQDFNGSSQSKRIDTKRGLAESRPIFLPKKSCKSAKKVSVAGSGRV